MDGSFGAAMAELVIEDASRMSGARFADARGTGVARRVRTRRRVRAAGMGGASAVAVGALALGASHMPWGVFETAPGIGATDCVTPSPSTGHVAYSVTPAEADQLRSAEGVDIPETLASDAVDKAWYQEDHAAGIPLVSVRHMKDGRWLVSIGSGAEQQVAPDESGAVTIDVTVADMTTSYRVVTPAEGGIKVATTTTTAVAGASSSAEDCYTPSPTPSVNPTLTIDNTYSAGPTLAAKPDDVIGDSPFECGFAFPTDSYGTDDLWIDGVEWFTPAEVEAEHPDMYGTGVTWGSAIQDTPVARATVHPALADLAEGDTASGAIDTGEPSLEKLSKFPLTLSATYAYSEGRTFVGVSDGKVVATGTLPDDDEAALASIFSVQNGDAAPHSELIYLINPSIALTSCDANPVDLAKVDIVAVAGVVVKHADGTVDGPTYAWLPIGEP